MTGNGLPILDAQKRRADHRIAFSNTGIQPPPVPLDHLVAITVHPDGIWIPQRGRAGDVDRAAAIVGFCVEDKTLQYCQ